MAVTTRWKSTATRSRPLLPQGKRLPGVTADLPKGVAAEASVAVVETEVAAAIAAAEAAELASPLRSGGAAVVMVDGSDVSVTADEVIVTETPREGWAVATEGGETVALDLTVTPELARAGLAREVIRLVQEARKNAGLEVSDRISLRWAADGDMALALRAQAGVVADEVLATGITEAEPGGDWLADDDLGLRFAISKA